jgi:hypothetical protein
MIAPKISSKLAQSILFIPLCAKILKKTGAIYIFYTTLRQKSLQNWRNL